VAGADSEYWPSAHPEWAASVNPRARAVVLSPCGHAANMDQPEAFNAALLEFLAEV
jgi:pimeloyl-ACP methyl ester carboxylesterase